MYVGLGCIVNCFMFVFYRDLVSLLFANLIATSCYIFTLVDFKLHWPKLAQWDLQIMSNCQYLQQSTLQYRHQQGDKGPKNQDSVYQKNEISR